MTTTAAAPTAHWMIYKNHHEAPERPWFVSHYQRMDDGHFEDDHEYGSFATHREALDALLAWSFAECGAPDGKVPYYGLELGVDSLTHGRVCALDVAGFQHLEQALAYAARVRGKTPEEVIRRAGQDNIIASTEDAEDEDMSRPLVGATVYHCDPEVGTTWRFDLLSWESPSKLLRAFRTMLSPTPVMA